MKLKVLLAALLGWSLFATPAGVTRAVVSAPVVISRTNPLPPADTPGWCGSDAEHQDWEEESTVAVNPANPDNVVAAWIQDWSDAIVVGYSKDGGSTRQNVAVPSNKCTGGPAQYDGYSVIDPWLSFGPDGTLYLTSTLKAATSNAIVNVSRDGGQTWSQPNVVSTAGTFPTGDYIEASKIVADPARAERAYLVRDRGTGDFNTPYFSSTGDGGKSWSGAVSIFDKRNNRQADYLPDTEPHTTDLWLRYSQDDAAAGERIHRRLPGHDARARRLRPVLRAGSARSFVAPSDIYFTRVRLKH